MSLENDAGIWTLTALTIQPRNWNETFSETPSGAIIFAVENQKKSAILNGTTTTIGVSAFSEVTSVRYLAKAAGYSPSGSTHPEFDSGVHDVAITKVLEAVTFHDTFSATPIVVTGYQGNDEEFKGGKTSAANITTTGCDVAGEIKNTVDLVNWFAIYTNGFWEG